MYVLRSAQSLFLILIFNLISGCTGLSVASSSASAVYNRHELQQKWTDQYITMQANHRIYAKTDRFEKTNISITTLNNEVLITGETPTAEEAKEIIAIVKSIPDVTEVYPYITVAGQASGLTHLSDGWITTKVKAKLMAMNDIDATRIKVITENGTVYLMGIVLVDQADLAVDIAQNTQGVQNVVKLFSYMRISKT